MLAESTSADDAQLLLHRGWAPLYDSAALETMAEDAARVARDAEAHYWRGMVERLTAQADAWNARYMALVQQVADGRAMQPAPPLLVDLGTNASLSDGRRPSA